MNFDTEITLLGPLRNPKQMLASQEIRGHSSLHDVGVATNLGLTGAPIEGPTHFSQFDPLAFLIWGELWFERGCISSHFKSMVSEGELVSASLVTNGAQSGSIKANKLDGSEVLVGSVSVGPAHPETELDRRMSVDKCLGPLFIIDQLEIGMSKNLAASVSISADEDNGVLYPFSLSEKLKQITEPHPWYTPEGGKSSPWGRSILPMEMISVLAHKIDPLWPLRGPSTGLFLDLEIRILSGPLFVGEKYSVSSEIVGLGESRRTESFWTLTTISETTNDTPVATVLLHSGVFKESFPDYPAHRLS